MIAKGSSIAHGRAAINYAMAKQQAVLMGTHHLGGNEVNDWLTQMELLQHTHCRIRNRFLRFELSPSKNESNNLSDEEWRKISTDFLRKMGLQDNQAVVILHRDDTPHLHVICNRVANDHQVYRDRKIGLRAGAAAAQISKERGWKDAQDVSRSNHAACYRAAMDTLQEMQWYDWHIFKEKMKKRGYRISENFRPDGTINGYNVLMPGQRRTEAFVGIPISRINRRLCYSRLQSLWLRMHPEYNTQIDVAELAKQIIRRYPHSRNISINNVHLIRRGYDGWAMRCKIDGVQQGGVDIPTHLARLISGLSEGQRMQLEYMIDVAFLQEQQEHLTSQEESEHVIDAVAPAVNIDPHTVGISGGGEKKKRRR